MTTLYKLTDENHCTYGGTEWGVGVTHETSGEGALCSSGWLHAYLSPELAVLLNTIHAGFKNPVLWEADGDVGLTDHQLKVGCKKLTTVRILEAPSVSPEQRVKFAIFCALAVYDDP